MSPRTYLDPRERRFAQRKIDGDSAIDTRCMHLMFRGRLAVLRGFYDKQRDHVAQPMPERAA